MSRLLIFCLVALAIPGYSQLHGFAFGKVDGHDLQMKSYAPDTSAVAVVLDEFGETSFENDRGQMVFEHHYKIKILKPEGLYTSTVTLFLHKYSSGTSDVLREVKAASYRLTDDGIRVEHLNPKEVYTKTFEHYNEKTFAIPQVEVGSVIEVYYKIQSPPTYNLKKWEFQREIPKIRSEYWASIPGNYVYKIALRGYQGLSKSSSEIVKSCFNLGGGQIADCALQKYKMENIPAFVEEEYMTAAKNFKSSINFELSEVKHFSGYTDRITKEWKDVEEELRKDPKFGQQLKRGADIVDSYLRDKISQQKNDLDKAKEIHSFIMNHFTWNDTYGKYCEQGIKKAFSSGTGNIGDINLSLIAALRYAGLSADPVILSTRENGTITQLYPVMSEFNYVVALLKIGDTQYLLDATDSFVPFGMVPFHCLNGKGRVIGDRVTSWVDIDFKGKNGRHDFVSLTLQDDGTCTGTIQTTYHGYHAIRQRKIIYSFSSPEEYFDKSADRSADFTIMKAETQDFEDPASPLKVVMDVELDPVGSPVKSVLLNPFLINKIMENPFKSAERKYPVDFGSAGEQRTVITLRFPPTLKPSAIPEPVGLALPNRGGKYILGVQNTDTQLSISSWLTIDKALYSAQEYHYLKELYNQVVQAQHTDIILQSR